MKRGMLLVVSSPSGAGKTTLCRRLVRDFPELRFSVSYTTRAQRTGEVAGVDYHYVSDAVFDQMVAEGAFAEWAHVHGKRYGTAVPAVRAGLEQGAHVLFDVDYQGAERLLQQFPADALLVFILPPSIAVLSQRLRGRGTDTPEVVAARLRKAREELLHYPSYHYLVVNDELDRAYAELAAVYLVTRAARSGALDAEAALPQEVRLLAARCAQGARGGVAEALVAQASTQD